MKKFFPLLLSCIATVIFIGCTKTPDPEPKPDPVPVVNIKLSEPSVMASSVSFEVTISDQYQHYLCLCVSKDFAKDKEDKELIDALMADLDKQAAAKSMSLRSLISSLTTVGDRSISIENLAPNTSYTVVVLAVSGVTPGAETARITFTTLAADKIDCTFEVGVAVDGNNVKYDIKPSNKETDWYFCTMTKKQYDEVSEAQKFDVNQMIIAYFAAESERLAGSGMTDDQILAQLLRKGDMSLEAKGLDAEKEYIYLAGAIARTDAGLVLVSDVKKDVYTTGKAPLSDMTFKITTENISKTSVDIKIEPSKLEEKYLMLLSNVSPDNKDMTPDEIMTSFYKGLGMWAGMSATSGVKDYKAQSVAAGLDYFVLAFGFAGGPTTLPEFVKFSTPAGQNPADATIDVAVNSVNSYGADLTFTPSDETVYFSFGLLPTGTVEKDSLIKYFELGLVENLKQQHLMFGAMNMTMVDVIMTGYFHDLTPFTFSKLKPNTTYDAFTMTTTMDGKVAAFKEHPAILKTPSVSSTTATAEIRGYFDGNQEAGTIFGNPELTKDQAIVVLNYTNFSADVAKIYSCVAQDNPDLDELDPTEISDEELRNNGKWNEVKIASPFEFVLGAWDKAMFSFNYTVAADGAIGAITRTSIAAPKQTSVGTIADLKKLYDQANVEDKAQTMKSAAKMVLPVKEGSVATSICKKDVSSMLKRYVSDANAGNDAQKQQVVVPYALGASINLPLARVVK